jgi:hypothetical protein
MNPLSQLIDLARDNTRLDRPSLAWLLISAAGSALAAIVVAGIVAGRLGLPIVGKWLIGAAIAGSLPQLIALARGRWSVGWPELAAALAAFAAVGGGGLALAWPSMLPLGLSVDAVHHTQLIAWIADHQAFPTPGGATQQLLGEMTAYPVGLALVVVAAASLTGQPLLETIYPTAALLGGLIAALVVLLASATARGGSQSPIFRFPALLVGPLLLLAHRAYLMEAYIDHSYYTMVLGVLLTLLAAAWLIVAPRLSLVAAAQFGLVLAALIGTYPLWAPLPAMLAVGAIIVHNVNQRGREKRALTPWSFGLHPSSCRFRFACYFVLALGPALGLGLLDLLPRLGVGQTVLAHEGLVTLPTAQR